MAAKKKTIQIEGTDLTIDTNNFFFQDFALEVARATRAHLDEINAGIAEEKKRKRREARERRKAAAMLQKTEIGGM